MYKFCKALRGYVSASTKRNTVINCNHVTIEVKRKETILFLTTKSCVKLFYNSTASVSTNSFFNFLDGNSSGTFSGGKTHTRSHAAFPNSVMQN